MFRRAITLPFRVFNIPIRLDGSFLVILPLFAFLIGSRVPAGMVAGPVAPYLLGLVAALGLFGSVLVHEIGHALTARAYGVQTKEITLWLLGGVAQLSDMPRQRGAEAVVAIAGPITSGLLALFFFGLRFLVAGNAPASFVVNYLSVTNVALAIFNLLPALPLDGGRVLRSLLALRLEYLQATRIAANISRVLAVLLGIFGLYAGQILLVLVAFFIFNAVQGETRYATTTSTLEGKTVHDLMGSDTSTVEPDLPLSSFRELVHYKKQLGYPVVEDNQLLGFANLYDAQEQTDATKTVADIMHPPQTILESDTALNALKRLSQDDQHSELVVVNASGELIGMLSRADVARELKGEEG